MISYQVLVANAGPDATSAIRLTDNLPSASDFQYQSAIGTNWNCSSGGTAVTCNFTGAATTGTLPAITVRDRVIRPSSGTITNNAFASLSDPLVLDPNAANNAAAPVVTNILEGSDEPGPMSRRRPSCCIRSNQDWPPVGFTKR